MKDLTEALREFDQRDKERIQPIKDASYWSGHISMEDRLFIVEGRQRDALQLISWLVGHVVKLEKGKAETK